MKDKRYILRIGLFILLFLAVFCGVSFFMKPVWREWNNYDTIHGFYEQPENTIETVFLGASTIVNGFAPVELYEDYGICAYNLGTEQQPMLASYYWLEEAYRLHSDSLKIAVLDTSMLRRTTADAFYRKAISQMKFSAVRYHAEKDYSDSINERLTYLVPLFEYHSRWSALEKSDFKKAFYTADSYTRGYHFSADQYLNEEDEMVVLESYVDESATGQAMLEESVYYLQKIVDFCNANDIKLVLMKTPVVGWSSEAHNDIQSIADGYGIEFYDFNYVPYLDEIAFHIAVDNEDGGHMNYWGAQKLTAWLGEYLTTYCNATDVRGDVRYAFMEEELERYHENVTDVVALKETDDLADYLKAALQLEDCIVFLAVQRDAAEALTQEQRDIFSELGLEKLSELTYGDSYLAVIEDGNVIEEQLQFWDQAAYEKGENVEGGVHISTTGTTKHKNKYTLISGGVMLGNEASCLIDETEYFEDVRGMHAVVWNYNKEVLVDAAVFDTHETSTRVVVSEAALDQALNQGVEYQALPDELLKLYLYERSCQNNRTATWLDRNVKEDGMWDFLSAYWEKEDYIIFMSAMEDAAGALDEAARASFEKIGLKELSILEKDDAYIAVIDGGNVLFEQKGQGGTRISTAGIKYEIASGGSEVGNASSIKIEGTEYSTAEKGMNIVIYDSRLNTVIDEAVFDTGTIPVVIAE